MGKNPHWVRSPGNVQLRIQPPRPRTEPAHPYQGKADTARGILLTLTLVATGLVYTKETQCSPTVCKSGREASRTASSFPGEAQDEDQAGDY